MAFSSSTVFRELVTEPSKSTAQLPLWLRLLIMFAVPATGWQLIAYSYRVLSRGKQHRVRLIDSFGQLDGTRYILYLRPFTLDPEMAQFPHEAPGSFSRSPLELPGLTQEEFLVSQFAHLGRVVAVGQPGERLPLPGAERGYLPVANWQNATSRLIKAAHVIVVFAAPGPGTVWEFTEAVRTVAPMRLLLLVYNGPSEYDAFRAAVAQEYATRFAESAATWPPPPQLPDLPSPTRHVKGLKWDFPLKGIVSFDKEWRASFTPFNPVVPRLRWRWTIPRLVRRELEPVLGALSQLPPAPLPTRDGNQPQC
jgi:hypothetical protein